MMHILTKSQGEVFLDRWQMVSEREIKELQETSAETKLQQLIALMASIQPLGWTTTLMAEEEKVRLRWNRLKSLYVG